MKILTGQEMPLQNLVIFYAAVCRLKKLETVTFEKELNIVKDYLALENMRFEDRLQVEYEIDEDTLDQPVPPMMLQTLVENAIKHGISKQINGGIVKMISDFKDNYHELTVQNTGQSERTHEWRRFWFVKYTKPA